MGNSLKKLGLETASSRFREDSKLRLVALSPP